MNRTDFQILAEARLEDAQVLFRNGRFDIAYYVAGYSVECALKACIAKLTRAEDFPPKRASSFYSHGIRDLLSAAGLDREFQMLFKDDKDLWANWGIVEKWRAESRYSSWGEQEAGALLSAISDPAHGVLTCIKRYW